MTVLTTVSALLGFVRDVVIAGVFGAGGELDAYLVAQGLMNLVLALVAGAHGQRRPCQCSPRRTAQRVDGADHASKRRPTLSVGADGDAARPRTRFCSSWRWLPRSVVTVLAPGFKGAQAELAASLTRIVLIATVLISGTNLLAAAAEAHRRFFWSAMQGVPFNLIMIVAAVAVWPPVRRLHALAVGFVVGSAARLLCQFVPIRALGLRLRASWDLKDPGFRSIAKLIPPLLVGSALGKRQHHG